MMKPLRSLKGVGDKTEKLFQKIGVITTEDLLEYFPRNYDAYEEPVTIGSLSKGETAAISGTVISSVYVNKVRNLQIVTVTIADATGKLPVSWFNTPYLRST